MPTEDLGFWRTIVALESEELNSSAALARKPIAAGKCLDMFVAALS
jgi:hypothetical protein